MLTRERLLSLRAVLKQKERVGFGATNDRQTVGTTTVSNWLGLGGGEVIYKVEGKHLHRKQAVSPIESCDSGRALPWNFTQRSSFCGRFLLATRQDAQKRTARIMSMSTETVRLIVK
jgi:hypothetical protein